MDTLEMQLMEAIRNAKLDVVQSLLDKGVNVNYIPSCGKSPLSTAAALGNIYLIQVLLNYDKSGKLTGQQDFFTGADDGWISSFEDDKENRNDCLTYKSSISNNLLSAEQKQNLGYYIFVHNDDPGGKEDFSDGLNRNENLDAETPEGMDGLEWDVEVEEKDEEEPDDVWSNQYRWYADILDKTGGLMEDKVKGCDLNLQDYTGRCAVHYAVEYSQLEALHCLISAGCKVDVGDVDNLTPLHLAAMRDHQEIAQLLIEKGANVNRKTTDKMTPLHYAAVRGLVEMVTLLISGGAHVDPLDANDRTPLMLAVTRDHLDVVVALIKYKAKINIEEIHGYTPLCEAVWNKSVEIASVLLKSGAKLTQSQHLLHYTVLHRHLAMAELLLRYGAYPNLRDDHGDTPLILAISCCHMDMIRLLLQYDASPNCANSVSGITPLHQAMTSATSKGMFDEILRLLCLHNVDLNMTSVGTCWTSLSNAVTCWKIDCAVSLIRAGADVNKAFDTVMFEPLEFLSRALFPKKWASGTEFGGLAYLLVTAGYNMSRYQVEYPKDFSKLNMETLDGWLTYMKFNPRRLTDLCRLNIRSQMGNKVLQLVPSLEIPRSLKQFLVFEDVLIK